MRQLPIQKDLEVRGPRVLKAHPLNEELYGDEQQQRDASFKDLGAGIRKKGVLTPLLITEDDFLANSRMDTEHVDRWARRRGRCRRTREEQLCVEL